MSSFLLTESVDTLFNNSSNVTKEEIYSILEDVNSPIARKYQEKLYASVLNKAHVDFGDIPKSEGNIRRYTGYQTMMDTLDAVESLAKEEKAVEVIKYVSIVKDAIKNIANMSASYEKGFNNKSEYVALEYNAYVYLTVQATTALIYSFIDVMKNPQKKVMEMTVKNSKNRADLMYFDLLKKFNAMINKHGMDYQKTLETMSSKNNFVGAGVIVGTAAIALIIPFSLRMTRKVLSAVYKSRVDLSEYLKIQSEFLELNKSCIESNQALTENEKSKILNKQTKQVQTLNRLSDKLAVKNRKAVVDTERELNKEDSRISLDGLRDEIENSSLELF